MSAKSRLERAKAELHEHALGYPEACEEFPWGESAFKVRGKTFAFLSTHDGALNLSVKLPQTHGEALMLPFAEPTGYNLGKSGWVTARFAAEDEPPVELLYLWIDESYRAVAPKKLAAQRPLPG